MKSRVAPTYGQSWRHYAIYLGEVEGRLDSAIAVIRKGVNLDPEPVAFNTLGDLLMRARRYDSAIVVLRRALDMDSTAAGPRQRLVTSYEATGQYALAVQARRTFWGEAAAPFENGWRTEGRMDSIPSLGYGPSRSTRCPVLG